MHFVNFSTLFFVHIVESQWCPAEYLNKGLVVKSAKVQANGSFNLSLSGRWELGVIGVKEKIIKVSKKSHSMNERISNLRQIAPILHEINFSELF